MRKLSLAILLVLLVSCAADDPAPAGSGAPEDTAATDTTSGGEASAGTTIDITGLSFGDPLTVGVGETVEVVNNDDLPHTWTADDGSFDVSLQPGDTTSHTFDEAGEYTFVCTIHPGMEGSITVEG